MKQLMKLMIEKSLASWLSIINIGLFNMYQRRWCPLNRWRYTCGYTGTTWYLMKTSTGTMRQKYWSTLCPSSGSCTSTIQYWKCYWRADQNNDIEYCCIGPEMKKASQWDRDGSEFQLTSWLSTSSRLSHCVVQHTSKPQKFEFKVRVH